MGGDVFARVRCACAEVARRARRVRIDDDALAALAAELADAEPPDGDPAQRALGDDAATLAYVLTLGAINFGSGWFPRLTKRPGMSGYFTIATALRERFEGEGPWSARELTALSPEDCARVFGQERAGPEAAQLMALFARALADLGHFLAEGHGGRFAGPVEAAGGCAARLVEGLAAMPGYRDVADYGGLAVPFYKRAQLTCADLAGAFHGRGPGRFDDLDRLTLFADNLVPHVLRCAGALVYDPDLAGRIDAGLLLEAGSAEEVEIRALAVHAVERCVERLRRDGWPATARQLDAVLWHRGQRPEIKARPRHRARCVFY